MLVKRNRPKDVRFASFGLALCVFLLAPNEIGLDYVSCSPYRVPIARLAAAQAAIGKAVASQA